MAIGSEWTQPGCQQQTLSGGVIVNVNAPKEIGQFFWRDSALLSRSEGRLAVGRFGSAGEQTTSVGEREPVVQNSVHAGYGSIGIALGSRVHAGNLSLGGHPKPATDGRLKTGHHG
jgi:hypothetical protein